MAKGTLTTFSCNITTNGFVTTESYVVGAGGEQISVVGPAGNWLRSNAYAGGTLLATYDTTGLHFHMTDAEGTRRVQTTYLGVIEEQCQNLPFGDDLTCSGTDATGLHYTGKERDLESGNDYFGARYYGSNSARFLTPDWSAKEQGSDPVPYSKLDNPQTLNLYAFVGNNPLTRVDKDGHCGVICAVAVSVAVAGIVNSGVTAYFDVKIILSDQGRMNSDSDIMGNPHATGSQFQSAQNDYQAAMTDKNAHVTPLANAAVNAVSSVQGAADTAAGGLSTAASSGKTDVSRAVTTGVAEATKTIQQVVPAVSTPTPPPPPPTSCSIPSECHK